MKDILLDLNEEAGIRGSAVMTPDGMMVMSALPADASEDVVSALASFVITTANRSLKESGLTQFEKMMLTATHGKILIFRVEAAYLVVVTDQFVDLDLAMVEVAAAASRLRRASKMTI
jgi:predicted regulator of Ras-like GTPase activity (Roadblock/LC7/MglB family)